MSGDKSRGLSKADSHKANTVCPTLTCDGGKCLPASAICNLVVDCFDGADELNCSFLKNGTRILAAARFETETLDVE
jgi:hypothetical protein